MVIINLIGGLGNQMFQYAAGRALSLKRGDPLRLDISGFSNYGLHQGFELERIFNCTAEIANETDVRGILGWQSSPLIRRVVSRSSMSAFRRKSFVVEPHFHYWHGINNVPCDWYLSGYWQSEKYFSDVAEQIRRDFFFRLPLENENSKLANKINQVNAVSLHVRRGDYANNPVTTATHGLCTIDYYRAAIEHVAERVRQPYFFIFSDDITWVKNNLKMDFQHHYVDNNNGAESYNDMRLMSMCNHHVIANSSFSWWGAWLNEDSEKIVIAPKRWFNNHLAQTKDLFPRGWVCL